MNIPTLPPAEDQGNHFWHFVFATNTGYRNLWGTYNLHPTMTAMDKYVTVLDFIHHHNPETRSNPVLSYQITPNHPDPA